MIKSQQGPSFCAAKWLQVTLDLYHGVSKSCHHTPWTRIDIEQVRRNPLYLTNTSDVLDDRLMMTKGIMPLSCHYCWQHEAHAPHEMSDRYHKTNSEWAQTPHYRKRLDQENPKRAQRPSYLEVLFDHRCQMRCVYCSADSSSAIEKELAAHGPYPARVHYHRSKRLQPSLYHDELKAIFFQCLPDLLPALHTLRLTGGEPLLSPSAKTLINYLKKTAISLNHLTLALNSNLMIGQTKWTTFIKDLQMFNHKLYRFQLFTSIDSAGIDAEYIRKGLDYTLFLKRLKEFGEYFPQCEIIIMVTFNKYSIEHFHLFLEDILALKKQTPHMILDISPLQDPDFLSIKNITAKQVSLIKNSLYYMQSHTPLFKKIEVSKMERLYRIAQSYQGIDHHVLMQQEQLFKKEFDRR